MIIDYVVISADDNPMYLDFYPIVAKRWNEIGIKVIMLHLSSEDSEEVNEYGIYRKIKKNDNISSGLQSQVARLYASVLYPEYNLLMSDIDMLPVNKDYFIDGASDINLDEIFIYSGQPYSDVPFFPMCYILARGLVLSEALGIKSMTFNTYIELLMNKYNNAWNTDENFMYDQIIKWSGFSQKVIIAKDRNFSRRIDRGNWYYQLDKLKNGYYIDSHLLRPYSQNREKIDTLIKDIS